LDRSAHLSAIDARAHHRAEGADVEEILAHEVPKPVGLVVLRIERLVRESFLVVGPDRDIGLPMLVVEDRALLDIDGVAGVSAFGDLGVVANLALEADVGDEALVRLGIETGQIAGVGVAVGVAVGDVEQKNKIIAMRQRGHAPCSCGAVEMSPRGSSLRR
jgi:hypothetical protein